MVGEKKKIVWKRVKVPAELHRMLVEEARREKIAVWKVIQRGVTLWRTSTRQAFKPVSDVSRCSWYVYKLSASVGELRGKPNAENLNALIATCMEVAKRLKVDTSLLVMAAEQYVKRPSKKERMVLNDAAKDVVAQIMLRFSGSGEDSAAAVSTPNAPPAGSEADSNASGGPE